MLKNNKYQCKKTSQVKTQCKGDISHASKTAKITVDLQNSRCALSPYRLSVFL